MSALHISKGFCLDTPEGHQEVIAPHGPTSFIVHCYDENDQYTGASILTDREIIHKWHDMTRKFYDSVVFDS